MKTCKKTIKGGKKNYKNNRKNKSRKQKPKKMVKKNIQYREQTPYPRQQYQEQQQYPQQQPQQIEVKDTTGLGRKALSGATTGFGLGVGLQLAESGMNYLSGE